MKEYQKLDGVVVTTATPTDTIIKNIKLNNQNNSIKYENSPDFRRGAPVAIIGGGSSLKDYLPELENYKYKIACGSVHDYLLTNKINPYWTVVCDPDPLVNHYLKKASNFTGTYLVASQCSPDTFYHLKQHSARINIWQAAGDNVKPEVFGDNIALIGGGCTVGTRAIVIAYTMGFSDVHLYGFDSCIIDNQSHSYPFNDPDAEKLETPVDILIGGDKFKVANYMLGQIYDFQEILRRIGTEVKFTVHGPGPLAKMLEMGKAEAQNGKEK